jgi:hypothetical protein
MMTQDLEEVCLRRIGMYEPHQLTSGQWKTL